MTQKTPKTIPFSIRLTPEERSDLERRAGKQALGDFIRARLFGQGRPASPVKFRPQSTTIDKRTAAQALGLLGKSGIASNLKRLSEAARLGALPVTKETEAAMQRACRDVAAIKSALMTALGIKER